ncbi:DUF6894 family protein [Shinella kummerowiae]|jgi:hypothetical protein|uniref:DUF6894 domain-containing protein n=1 Tax=Shinella kummerowiae TaxID=417745 RepID=A0A6N8SPR6_9HYPH|nr:hypothetical protein [Shinella kummerowiae]MCT7668075.1 hypothetical protein [Shinella kummerowiae]MXN49186.1 hypothetical protein [Shinella kummerowiae]
MPRYFFHVLDGRAAIDDKGLFLANETQARVEALRGAGEMLADADMNVWLGNEWMMAVTDATGSILFKLRFEVDFPKLRTGLGA